jgi:hypothetical protein
MTAGNAVAESLAAPPATPAHATGEATAEQLRKDVQRQITAFARVCGFADCLCLLDTLPTGFYVEPPADEIPLDLAGDDGRQRYVGWWLAAIHSGQIRDDVSTLLPTDSPWRQAQASTDPTRQDSLSALMETVLGNELSIGEFVDWLGAPANPALPDYQHLLRSIQRLRLATQHDLAPGVES